MKKTALVLIDIQNIYFTEGPYKLSNPEKAASNAKKVLDLFRKNEMPVVHVKHAFKTESYAERSDYLNAIYEGVAPSSSEHVVDKKYPNSFLETDLLTYLQTLDIKDLVIAGMMSHMCVDTTVRACQDYGFHVTVLEDACTTKSLQWRGTSLSAELVHASYMAGLDKMFANVVCIKEYLNALE